MVNYMHNALPQKDNHKTMSSNDLPQITAIDLFSGAGGFSLAALSCKMTVLAAVENYQHACTTYLTNFIEGKKSPPHLFNQDIRSLCPKACMKELGIGKGELDILMGGPPCQGFSSHRFKDAGVDDPRNELLLRYFHFVEILAPKAFIVENVSGMLWKRHEKYVSNFYQLAKDAGYHVLDPIILNAKEYGVPQNRKRVFILGFRTTPSEHLIWPPKPTHFSPTSNEVLNENKPSWPTAAMVFETSLNPNDPNNIHMNHTKELVEVFKSTPPNGGSRLDSNRTLPCHQNGYGGHKDVYGRIDPDKVGPTITASCTNPSKGRFLHPTEHHGITIRHAARFQTFPDDFVFAGGVTTAATQVGNAVPLRLGKQVLKSVLSGLDLQC